MEIMEDFRMADPEFVNFEPRSASQAIIRFRRLQRLGLDPWRYPEAFIECCKLLPPKEVDKFEAWMVNPSGFKSRAEVKLPLPVPSCSEEKTAHS
jgi:hypothetical protein